MITARQFSQTFERVTHEQMATLLQRWSSQPQFTQCIKHQMMPAIASALNCGLELEYKRIDIVFRALSVSNGDANGDARIVVAIEHENNFGGSHSEVTKLRDLMAPLGVLITYVSPYRRQQLIAEFSKIMSASAGPSDAANLSKLLVITGPYGMKPPKSITWEYFVCQDGEFQPLDL